MHFLERFIVSLYILFRMCVCHMSIKALTYLFTYLVPFRSYRRLVFYFWAKKPLCVFSSFLAFLEYIGATYTVHLRLIGKLVMDFLFVLSGLFFARCYRWRATSEYWLEIGFLKGVGDFCEKSPLNTNRKSITSFPMSLRWTVYVAPMYPKKAKKFRPNVHAEGDVPTNHFCTDR